MSRFPPPVLPLAALATAVLLGGVAAASTLSAPPLPSRAEPAPAPGPARTSPELPEPENLTLAIRRAARPAAPTAYDPGNPATWSVRQLATQLVFSCVQAGQLGTATAHSRAGLGGVVVMGRPTDRAVLTDGLARARAAAPHGIAPLIASDEEGGRVQRLKGLLGPLPSAAVMGRWPDARIAQTAQRYGEGMRALGVQLALSPVADLAAPGGYPAATERAFSANPQRVAGAVVAWSQGLQRAGVLSAVKHWPGHGTAVDSHTSAPAVPPLAALEGKDLLPFDAVHRSGASVVMVGHLRSAGLTEPGLPATLSPNAMKVLRKRTGPATVVLTDSVSMAASSSALGLTPPAAAVRALQAGADWAMSCVNPMGAADAVQAALSDGRLPRAQAVASVARILAVKQRLRLLSVPPTSASPTGALDSARLTGSVVTLAGRAADPDVRGAVRVRVLVNGAAVTEVLTDADKHTYVVDVPALPGAEICALALNNARGPATPFGCVTHAGAHPLSRVASGSPPER